MKNIHVPTIEELLRPESEFGIEEYDFGHRISGIQYRGKTCTYDIGTHFPNNRLLPSGTQEEHAVQANAAAPDSFRAASAPLIHAICKTLYRNRDGKHQKLVTNVRNCLQMMFSNRLNTLSQVIYQPTLKDIIRHNLGQTDKYDFNEDLTGPNTPITEIRSEATNACKLILEDDDLLEINNIYRWITEADTQIFRYDKKPVKEAIVRPVVLCTNRDHFVIDAFVNLPTYKEPAIGVRPA